MSVNVSIGYGLFTYEADGIGSAIDLSAYDRIYFDWAADLEDASVRVRIFSPNPEATGAVWTDINWTGLPSTGGTTPSDLQRQSTMLIDWTGVDATNIIRLDFRVDGVANLDSTIDNITLSSIPIPPTIWLFGSGLLGLVGISRRKKAA